MKKKISRMEQKQKLEETLMVRLVNVVTHDNKVFDTSSLLTPAAFPKEHFPSQRTKRKILLELKSYGKIHAWKTLNSWSADSVSLKTHRFVGQIAHTAAQVGRLAH